MTSETVEAVAVALDRFACWRPRARRLLLAVSGGPDSLALLLALAQAPGDLAVHVATVDHRLRPESAGEAAHVADFCRDLGLSHRTLVWTGASSFRGNAMGAARDARYRLLVDEAARIGAEALLTAHHADDQIETHLLAQAREATGAALAGMRPWRDLEPGLGLLRPFLKLPKRVLVEAVATAGWKPVLDPSNADRRFQRVRARGEIANGTHDAETLRRAVERAASLREAEDRAAAAAIRQACDGGRLRVDPTGGAVFQPSGDDAAIWSRLLTSVGGGLYPPERASVDRLASRFGTGEGSVSTLAGCRVERGEDGFVLRREFGRSGPDGVAIEPGGVLRFDRRFTITGSFPPGAARIEPLGRLGLGGVVHRALPVCLDGNGAPIAVHPALCERFPALPTLTAWQRVGWRTWADLPGEPPDRLTDQPQNAANGFKAVGKDLAATYLRGQVKVRAP